MPSRGAPARLLHDIRVGARRGGASALVRRVLAARLAGLWSHRRLVVIEQETSALTDVPMPEGVRIAPLQDSPAESGALDDILTSGVAREFRRRIASGRECLIAWRGDRVIGYTWMSRSVDPAVEGLPLALPEDAAYLWDLFVLNEERGTGVGSALTAARLAWARDEGFALGWRAVRPHNRPSVRTAEKTGALRVLGELWIRRRFGHRRLREIPFGDRPLLTAGVRPTGSGPAGTSR